MGLKRRFKDAVKQHFAAITPLLDAELAEVAMAPHPEGTRFLMFEYDSPQFSDSFAVSVWAMDDSGNATGAGRWLLAGQAEAVPPEVYDAPRYEDIAPWATASKLLERWMAARWNVVHGSAPAYPAFIGHHDSHFKAHLRSGAKTSWDDILGTLSSPRL